MLLVEAEGRMGTFYSPLTIDAHTFSAHTFTVHLSANLLPRTPTHTTKICRRKIEKFLARKQNCDEKSVKLLDDGRFDFQGDIEGVLGAVRGKDGGSRRRGGGDKKKKVNTETGFRKTSRKVTKSSSYNQNQPINLQQMPAQMQMQMQTDPMQMQMQMNGVAYEPYFSGDVEHAYDVNGSHGFGFNESEMMKDNFASRQTASVGKKISSKKGLNTPSQNVTFNERSGEGNNEGNDSAAHFPFSPGMGINNGSASAVDGLDAMIGFESVLRATPSNYNLRMTPGRSNRTPSNNPNTPFDMSTKMFASGGMTPMLGKAVGGLGGVAQTPTNLNISGIQTPGMTPGTSMMKSLVSSLAMTPSSPAISDFPGGLFSPAQKLTGTSTTSIEKKLDIEGEGGENLASSTTTSSTAISSTTTTTSTTTSSTKQYFSSIVCVPDPSPTVPSSNLEAGDDKQKNSTKMPVNRISLSQSAVLNYAPRGSMPPPSVTSVSVAKTPSLLSAITPSTSSMSAEFERTRRDTRRKSLGMKITDLMSPEEGRKWDDVEEGDSAQGKRISFGSVPAKKRKVHHMAVSSDDVNMNMDELEREKENIDPNTNHLKRTTRKSGRRKSVAAE